MSLLFLFIYLFSTDLCMYIPFDKKDQQFFFILNQVPLNDLQDTVPVDKILPLKRSRWFFLGQNAGELVVRLTYKAYVEDEEEAGVGDKPLTNKVWNEIGNFISQEMEDSNISPEKRQLRDKIVMSVDAQRGDGGFRFSNPLITEAAKKVNNNTMTTSVNGTNLNSNNVMEEPNNSASVKDPIQRSRADKSWGSWLKTFREDSTYHLPLLPLPA